MTIDRAKELLKVQADLGGAYNRHYCTVFLTEVLKLHGQAAVDQVIHAL